MNIENIGLNIKIKKEHIHGMVHCSGGAQTKILHFIDQLHIVKDTLFEIPPLFKLIQKESKTDWKEMYQVFNMGHRMELYVPESIAETIIAISESFNIPAQIIGRVESSEKKRKIIIMRLTTAGRCCRIFDVLAFCSYTVTENNDRMFISGEFWDIDLRNLEAFQ